MGHGFHSYPEGIFQRGLLHGSPFLPRSAMRSFFANAIRMAKLEAPLLADQQKRWWKMLGEASNYALWHQIYNLVKQIPGTDNLQK